MIALRVAPLAPRCSNLANAQFRGGKVPYRTYLRYAGGLEAGAPVLFGGIKTGSVTAVHPWASDPTRIDEGGVKVEVELSAQMTDIRTGTTVWANRASDIENVAQRNVPAVVSEMSHTMDRTIEKLLSSIPAQRPSR